MAQTVTLPEYGQHLKKEKFQDAEQFCDWYRLQHIKQPDRYPLERTELEWARQYIDWAQSNDLLG